jgi:hypothetical protein
MEGVPFSLRAWAASVVVGVLVIAVPGGPAFDGSPVLLVAVLLLLGFGLYRRSALAWWLALVCCLGLLPATLIAITSGGPTGWDVIALGVFVGVGTGALVAGQTRAWIRPRRAGQ